MQTDYTPIGGNQRRAAVAGALLVACGLVGFASQSETGTIVKMRLQGVPPNLIQSIRALGVEENTNYTMEHPFMPEDGHWYGGDCRASEDQIEEVLGAEAAAEAKKAGEFEDSDENDESSGHAPTGLTEEEHSILAKAMKNQKGGDWPGGVVKYRYKLKKKHSKKTFKKKVQAAMDYITEQAPGVTFEKVSYKCTKKKPCLKIKDTGNGCSATVGYVKGVMKLAKGCMQKGTIVHELLHVLGFWHEQSRPDRDNYIELDETGKDDKKLSDTAWDVNFVKTLDADDVEGISNMPYDFGSIMHYKADAFSKGVSTRTINPKDEYKQEYYAWDAWEGLIGKIGGLKNEGVIYYLAAVDKNHGGVEWVSKNMCGGALFEYGGLYDCAPTGETRSKYIKDYGSGVTLSDIPVCKCDVKIGQRDAMSALDIELLNSNYPSQCKDSTTWESKYGKCSSYAKGGKNQNYCNSDKGKASALKAKDACRKSCKQC